MTVLSDLPAVIKKLATDAVEGSNPTAVRIGTVIGVSPLKVRVDQKLILTEEFLILTKSVVDYTISMTVNHMTESHTHSHGYTDDSSNRTTDPNTHAHSYTGKKKFTIHNGVKIGDKVILLRIQGGQDYIVLDKAGGGSL